MYVYVCEYGSNNGAPRTLTVTHRATAARSKLDHPTRSRRSLTHTHTHSHAKHLSQECRWSTNNHLTKPANLHTFKTRNEATWWIGESSCPTVCVRLPTITEGKWLHQMATVCGCAQIEYNHRRCVHTVAMNKAHKLPLMNTYIWTSDMEAFVRTVRLCVALFSCICWVSSCTFHISPGA